ncbi:MAG: ATP-binding protein, partial [Eubacteriales bacterium]|nr:ATP-binding protein [Eubacteriales bacterium]
VLLFSILLTPAFGIAGVYAANVLNGVAAVVIILAYAWIKNREFPRTMEKLMVIDKGFGVPADSRIDVAVRSMDEVVGVSRRVHELCQRKGIDARRTYLAALVVEEMAGNVVKHGFSKDKKAHCAEIRVSCKGDALILRIKDDCKPFNPEEYRRMMHPEDPTKNVGIRLVFSLSKDIRYCNILGMNALTIKI